ncbi:hypothetical protein SLEP1_g3691 [Rubroshorea leprosula]|uniref:Uncharacterized protein n=1 Tax=Rubroshorea leprosula TaxID=152421 RepID=A0AAV5HTU2_9ROSI|nr:hypothetical protein SLEP1_g3691 [Rubroshorea leprosula]
MSHSSHECTKSIRETKRLQRASSFSPKLYSPKALSCQHPPYREKIDLGCCTLQPADLFLGCCPSPFSASFVENIFEIIFAK